MPLAAMAGIGAIGSIGSALIGSNSASNAADAQQKAAQQAAQLQLQGSNNALNYQNGIYGQTQQNLNPYINAGGGGLNMLQYMMGINPTSTGSMVPGAQGLSLPGSSPQSNVTSAKPISGPIQGPSLAPTPTGAPIANPVSGAQGMSAINPTLTGSAVPRATPISGGGIDSPLSGPVSASTPQTAGTGSPGGFGSLTQGYGQQFTAPTALTEQNDPGYQARLALGQTAMEKSAAARGNILTGGTAQAENQAAQDYASNEYNNVYNRALTGFNTNYGVWNNDNNNIFSRLMGLTGVGQNASNALGSFGQQSANNVTQNLLGTGQQIGQDYGLGAQANASGIYNSGSAMAGGLNGVTGNLQQLLMLQQLGLGGGGHGGNMGSVNVNSGIPGVAD